MHVTVYYFAILWHVGLIAVLAVFALRASRLVDRALALDTLAVIFVAGLTLVAVHREEPDYLDVALVLALLGFVQTVATVRLVERRRDLE